MCFDGVDDGLEVFQTCGDFFQKKLVFDGEPVEEDAVDGEGAQHPDLGGVAFQFPIICNIIVVAVSCIAFDTNAEHFFN